MNTRHRIPSLFSLSMVDVLCCALGCVILLWLVNSREARQRNEVAGKTKVLLEQTSQKLDLTANERDKTKSLLDETTNKYNATLADLEKSQADVAKLQADMADLLKKNKNLLAALNLKADDNKNLSEKVLLTAKQISQLEKLLQQKDDDFKKEKVVTADLLEKLAASDALAKLLQKKLETSDKNLKNLTGNLDQSGKQVAMLTGKLDASEKEIVKLLSQVEDAKKLNKQLEELLAQFKQDAKDFAVKLEKNQSNTTAMSKELDKKNQDLEKSKTRIEDLIRELEEVAKLKKALEAQLALSQADLSKAKSTIAGLNTEKIDLGKKADLFKSLWANRFEGIELSGKRVIFMVDISGSMRLVDSKKEAPEKWNEVCEILGKLMRNLPDLTHYQVIAFSDSVIYPLGYENKWLVYDPKTSPSYLLTKMKAITPKGGTNIYPAFEEAFKYKIGNLDTIYFISDGLPDPNQIPPSIQNLSKVEQTTYFCNQIRQQLKEVWNAPVNKQVPVRINTIGFFFESPDVGAFLWALARENNGNFVGMSKP